jgi:hypothetical protein
LTFFFYNYGNVRTTITRLGEQGGWKGGGKLVLLQHFKGSKFIVIAVPAGDFSLNSVVMLENLDHTF